jgi:hypothetical protein
MFFESTLETHLIEYARGSRAEQDTAWQIDALKAAR